MKLKSFLQTLCLICAAVIPAVTLSSCSSDSSSNDSTGYTPIRPTILTMENGDVITIGTTGMSFNSSALYQCSLSLASTGSTLEFDSDGYTSYEDSSNNAATKSLYMYLGILDITSYYGTTISSMTWSQVRTLTIFFDSRNTGYVVSDSWYNNSTASLAAVGYAPYTRINFE